MKATQVSIQNQLPRDLGKVFGLGVIFMAGARFGGFTIRLHEKASALRAKDYITGGQLLFAQKAKRTSLMYRRIVNSPNGSQCTCHFYSQ